MTDISSPASRRIPHGALLAVLFTATVFLSASLLFFVQPLFTRIALPAIGGASAVWTTAMLFFQTVLIGGYLYAHVMTQHFSQRVQIAVHLTLWAAALLFLPLALPSGWNYDPAGSMPLQTLALYAMGVGLPFAVLSANAPLIQSWYGKSGGPSAQDPYFLYGASNLGSLIALLAFPLVAEPLFGIKAITWGWAVGFVALGALLLTCGLAAKGPTGTATADRAEPAAKVTMAQLGLWAFLSFVPSSLMLGATTAISTDIGAFPLIWVVPLALYLLTFVLTFTNRPLLPMALLRPAFAAALAVMAVLVSGIWAPHLNWTMSGVLILAVFIATLMAHRLLYEARPAASQLTLFYVVMSIGGALGGLFNSILAPLLFDRFWELRVTVGLAALLFLAAGRFNPRAAGFGLAVGVAAMVPPMLGGSILTSVPQETRAAITALVLMAGLWALTRPGSKGEAGGATMATLTVLASASVMATAPAVFLDRSFFGPHAVRDGAELRVYANGTTLHGAEKIAELTAARPTPLTYYHPGGPMGKILSSPLAGPDARIGVVGLGVGSLACYGQPGQDWHFYEIDRKVDEIARNPALFTFMSSCAGAAPTHLGDARIVLDQQKDMKFDILVIDAFSSDAVPVHLTTLEAVQLYRDRLAKGGILVFHISNRYYRIDVPLARSVKALGLTARIQNHFVEPDQRPAAVPSTVVIIAEDEADFGAFSSDAAWKPLADDGGPVWTDDHANLLSIMR